VSQIIQYPKKALETWRTGRLGCAYMNHFRFGRRFQGSQIEIMAEILAKRDFKERLGILKHMQNCLRIISQGENYEEASILRDMILYYNQKVMG